MRPIKPNLYDVDKVTITDDILYEILNELLFLNQSQKALAPNHFEKTYTLHPGQILDITEDLKSTNESGILKLIQIHTTSEEAIFQLRIDANTITTTPKMLAEWRLFGEKRNMFWISSYDNTVSPHNIKLCYNTDTVYTQQIKAKIQNPTSNTITFFLSVYRLIRR